MFYLCHTDWVNRYSIPVPWNPSSYFRLSLRLGRIIRRFANYLSQAFNLSLFCPKVLDFTTHFHSATQPVRKSSFIPISSVSQSVSPLSANGWWLLNESHPLINQMITAIDCNWPPDPSSEYLPPYLCANGMQNTIKSVMNQSTGHDKIATVSSVPVQLKAINECSWSGLLGLPSSPPFKPLCIGRACLCETTFQKPVLL